MEEKEIQIIDEQTFKSKIYFIRNQKVMMDADLAEIYGYTTKDFNRQVKNNKEKFDDDFMFQLSNEETQNLRCKNSTSSWGGSRYNPFAFTEQGIYMLMTVLKGPLATQQSKTLIRLFNAMKEYVVSNQALLGEREYLQLSMQTSRNTQEIIDLKSNLSEVNDKMASVVDQLGNIVTKSELADIMLDFGNTAVKRGWLILNGEPVESDLAYQEIYSRAKGSIYIIDNYIGLKTLVMLKQLSANIQVSIFSDNINRCLHKAEFDDFCREYPNVNIMLKKSGGKFHDRYIVLDYNTHDEIIYHCGASSKDGGNKVTTISLVSDTEIYHNLIDSIAGNDNLVLR